MNCGWEHAAQTTLISMLSVNPWGVLCEHLYFRPLVAPVLLSFRAVQLKRPGNLAKSSEIQLTVAKCCRHFGGLSFGCIEADFRR